MMVTLNDIIPVKLSQSSINNLQFTAGKHTRKTRQQV